MQKMTERHKCMPSRWESSLWLRQPYRLFLQASTLTMTLKLKATPGIINQACRPDADVNIPCGALETQAVFNVQLQDTIVTSILCTSPGRWCRAMIGWGEGGIVWVSHPMHLVLVLCQLGCPCQRFSPRSSLANPPDHLYHRFWHPLVIYASTPSSAFLDTSEGGSCVWRVRVPPMVRQATYLLAVGD